MRQLIISEKDGNQRLDKYLSKYMQKAPKSFFYKMFRKKNITLNGKKCEGNEKLNAGDEIKLFLSDETIDNFREETLLKASTGVKVTFTTVYEDEDILICDKPRGVLSQKANPSDVSMNEQIREYLLNKKDYKFSDTFTPAVCNRLDRNTSGLITAGKTLKGAQLLSEAFREHNLDKYYICIVRGKIDKRMKVDAYLVKNEKNNTVKIYNQEVPESEHIITEYIPVKSNGSSTLLKINLHTGKPHQIRAHLAYLGHALLGDYKYGIKKECDEFKEKYKIDSQMLHSFELDMKNPKLRVIAPIPKYFMKVLSGEKLWEPGKAEDLEALH